MFALGHSHIDCVFHAANAVGAPITCMNLWTLDATVIEESKTKLLYPQIAERLTPKTASFIGGGAQHILGHTLHSRPFDFVLPSDPDMPLTPGVEIIGYDALRAAVIDVDPGNWALLRLVASTPDITLCHVAPPPPLWRERDIDHALWRARPGATQTVSPPHLRLKLWRLHWDTLADIAAESGITLIPPPPETVDESGFLKPEFGGNPCHGNEAYGARVLAQLLAFAA